VDPLLLDDADRRLRFWFDGCARAAVAFSGGIDSALVAWYARTCLGRGGVEAWIADSPSLKRADLAEAEAFAAAHDIPLRSLATGELEDPRYAANPVDRCFFCKDTLYRNLLDRLAGRGEGLRVCSGANADDQGDYRPGMQAASDHAVRHPLLECGLGKEMVRALARRHGLECAEKPASPCLSSRIPYGQAVTREKLAQIEAGEAWLQAQGFAVCRLRHHGERAVIEVPTERLAALQAIALALEAAMSEIGFAEVLIDAEGFVSGKLNRGVVA
jgi:uncharacterized protein